MRPVPTGPELRRFANALRLEVLTGRLLDHLFPDEPAELERPGRYRALETAIESSAPLRQALDRRSHDAIAQAWREYLRRPTVGIDLHHTLAVLYREKALAQLARTGSCGERLVIATSLWVALLATDDFWKPFGDPPDRTELVEKVAGELLDLNATQGAQALAAGRVAAARHHLLCLDTCRSEVSRVREMLQDLGIPYPHAATDRLFAGVSGIAADALDHWCSGAVADAEKRVKDPEAITKQPEGIRQDYQSGIDQLTPLVGLGVPLPRALSTALRWYTDWFFDLYAQNETQRIVELLDLARDFADRLAQSATTGRGHSVESQALSDYFKFRGFVADDDHEAARQYVQALAWNPANANASELLAKVYVRLGDTLAEDGKFTRALEYGRKAQRLEPDDPAVSTFVREMTEMLPEEGTLALIKSASRKLNDDQFSEAIRELDQVPAESTFAESARHLRMQAYLGRGVSAVNNAGDKLFDKISDIFPLTDEMFAVLGASPRPSFQLATKDIRAALTLADREEDRKFIRTQLSAVLNAWAVKLLNTRPGQTDAAERLIRQHAMRLLEEATELDPSNAAIRQNQLNIKRALGNL